MILARLIGWYRGLTLHTKFALHAALSIGVLFSILIPGVVYLQKSAVLEQAQQRGLQLTKVFAHASVQALVADDFLIMRQIVNSIASEADVRYVMILGPTGRVLAHHDLREAGRLYSDPSSVRAADATQPLVMSLPPGQGPGYDFAVPIYVMNERRAVARLGISLDRELAAIRQTRNTILGLAVFALAAALGWAAWQARSVTRPVSALARGAQEISRGNLAHRIDIAAGDELGDLAAAFNRMAESVRSLMDVSRELSSSLDPDAVLRSVAVHARNLVKADTATLALFDRRTREARVKVVLGARSEGLDRIVITPGLGLGGVVLVTGEPMVSDDYLQDQRIVHDPLYDSLLRQEGIAAVMAVPIVLKGDTVGILWVANRSAKTFDPQDVDTLRHMAHQAAIAMENARLYAETRLKTARLEGLLRVSQAVTATLDPERIVAVIVQAMADLVAGSVVRLWAARDDGRLELLSGGELPPGRGEARPTIGPGSSLVGAVAAGRRPLAVEDLRREAGLGGEDLLQRDGLVSFLGLPLIREDRTLGVLAIGTRAPHRFVADDIALFATFAQQAAIALENARLYQDLKRSHADLVTAQAELVRKTRMAAIGEIAAAVAHEARNPLGALSNCVQMLRDNLHLSGEDAELLDIVHAESQRLNEIVSDFLAFGRPRPPHLDDVNVHEVIEATLTLLRRDARCAAAIVFTTKFDAGLPSLRADRDQLRQVFWNLFLNAVQAMREQGELRVETGSHDGQAHIVVQDTGPGIPAPVRERIFEPFYTTRAGGTGLGLAIVRRIIEEHRGTIRVDWDVVIGTCFIITLPLGAEAA